MKNTKKLRNGTWMIIFGNRTKFMKKLSDAFKKAITVTKILYICVASPTTTAVTTGKGTSTNTAATPKTSTSIATTSMATGAMEHLSSTTYNHASTAPSIPKHALVAVLFEPLTFVMLNKI